LPNNPILISYFKQMLER